MSLEREIRQVLAEMTLIQHGRTQALNATGGRSDNPDPRPQGETQPMHEEWAARWARDPSERTVEAARAELNAWRVRQVPADGDGTGEDDWILKDGEGFEAGAVARQFNTTPTRVRKLRLANERESEFGLKTRFAVRAEPDARERVLNLAAQGCTLRQIEMQTGRPRETVRRWLKEAA